MRAAIAGALIMFAAAAVPASALGAPSDPLLAQITSPEPALRPVPERARRLLEIAPETSLYYVTDDTRAIDAPLVDAAGPVPPRRLYPDCRMSRHGCGPRRMRR